MSTGRSTGERLRRLWQFGAVSVMSIVITQALLQGAYRWTNLGAVGSNIFAVGVSAIPAFLILRRWVWGKVGKHSITREIIPFWAYTFFGLVLSTLVVAFVDSKWHSAIAVSLANIAAFGALWITKFLLLDRWMFADRPSADPSQPPPDPEPAGP